MKIDLSDMLPQKPVKKLSLQEFLPNSVPREPVIFSDPLAVELHMRRTLCRCGNVFLAPDAVFYEVQVKELRHVGLNHYYKLIGARLIEMTEPVKGFNTLPQRVRTQDVRVAVCPDCITSPHSTPGVEPMEHWEIKRPQILSEAWKRFQLEVNPSQARLKELVDQIEARERYKDAETIVKPKLCDPELQLEE